MNLLKHSTFNLLGLGLPLVVAVFTIPVLIEALGVPRFGLLTMVWAVVSYFGLFDLGLGRALTQQLAVVLANEDHAEVGPLIGTATLLMGALGVVAGLAMAAVAPWAVAHISDVPDAGEALRAVYAMAIAMPAVVLTSGSRGVLEARHAFGVVNLIRLPMGLFTFLGPLAVVAWAEPRLDYVACVLALGRVVACLVHWYCARRALPPDSAPPSVDRKLFGPLCTTGGWLTVSNVISPLMGYADRFVIGALVSATAVAYYVTPHELITKLWIVPGAITAVLFPAFAAQVSQRSESATELYHRVLYWLYVILLPITLSVALWADALLSIWINEDFARQSARLLQIFSLGMFVTCLANIPFTLIQSAGKARTTALIHAAELPLFLVALWYLTTAYGVVGAAVAWLLRVLLDAMLMFAAARPLLPTASSNQAAFGWTATAIGCTVLGYAGVLLAHDSQRIVWIVATIAVIGLLAGIRRRCLPASA